MAKKNPGGGSERQAGGVLAQRSSTTTDRLNTKRGPAISAATEKNTRDALHSHVQQLSDFTLESSRYGGHGPNKAVAATRCRRATPTCSATATASSRRGHSRRSRRTWSRRPAARSTTTKEWPATTPARMGRPTTSAPPRRNGRTPRRIDLSALARERLAALGLVHAAHGEGK